jgi:hypothetical protein
VGASTPSPNPRRVAAGRLNRQKRRGLTPEGRERLRQAALACRPWLHASGPKTVEGKARSAQNGRGRQVGEPSGRALRGEFAALSNLAADMATQRRLALRPQRSA